MALNDQSQEIKAWVKREEDLLVEKLESSKERVNTAETKLDGFRALTEKQVRKKFVNRLRGIFKRPFKNLYRLQIQGEDIVNAAEEGLKPYRMQRLIDKYASVLEKLHQSIDEAQQSVDEYPSVSEIAGGFEWTEEIPRLRDDDGFLKIITPDGVMRSKITSES